MLIARTVFGVVQTPLSLCETILSLVTVNVGLFNLSGMELSSNLTFVNVSPKLQLNEKTSPFCSQPPTIAHKWMIAYDSSANKILAFSLRHTVQVKFNYRCMKTHERK